MQKEGLTFDITHDMVNFNFDERKTLALLKDRISFYQQNPDLDSTKFMNDWQKFVDDNVHQEQRSDHSDLITELPDATVEDVIQ